MNITDKDICHQDTNSKSFVVEDTYLVESFLSDEQLDKLINFLVTKISPKL
jgi:hypothetical protein